MKPPVTAWKSWLRKGDTIRSVSRRALRLDADQFVETLVSIQSSAVASPDPLYKTRCFWKMEKTSAEFVKTGESTLGLRDGRLPREVQPIAHCGMGIGAVEMLGFEPEPLLEVIERFSHPDYRPFAWESIGAMLGVYEPGPFLRLARGMRRIGLIPMADLSRPELHAYVDRFAPDRRDLLAHGFGRLAYFRNHSVEAAIRAIRATSVMDYASCVRGVAFAMAMVNSRDVEAVIAHDYDWKERETRAGFEAGLVYALVFWDWMSPGFLEKVEPRTGVAQRRLEAARQEIASSRSRGFPQAFRLSNAD